MKINTVKLDGNFDKRPYNGEVKTTAKQDAAAFVAIALFVGAVLVFTFI